MLLNASSVPGLFAALSAAQHGARPPASMDDGTDLRRRVQDPRPLDVLILDDQIQPYPDTTVEHTLWDLIYLTRQRAPTTRVLLLLHDDRLPLAIREQLVALVQEQGGAVYSLPRQATADQQRAAVAWVLDAVPGRALPAQQLLVSLASAGGVGRSTTLANLAIGLARAGQRVLLIDAQVGGSLRGHFKIAPGSADSLSTLRQEFPSPLAVYPRAAIQQRIVAHPAGIELLLAGGALGEREPLTIHLWRAALATIGQLPYSVVAIDVGCDLHDRLTAEVLGRGALALVVAQGGRRERQSAAATLLTLSQYPAPDGARDLRAQAALLTVAAEHGSVADDLAAHQDLLRQHPGITDLGRVPRAARLISTLSERLVWASVFAAAPHDPYCRALDQAAARLAPKLPVPTVSPAPPARHRWARLAPRRPALEEPR